jgi:hypothetical protein
MTDENEVITDTSESDTTRRIRVYDPKGDFLIDVPAGAKVTFGYFNPAASRSEQRDDFRAQNNVARQTALRIYERGEKGNQLACFIGVTGFRDEVIGLVRTKQRVVIERNLNDDGEGHVEWGGREQRQLVAVLEEDSFS